MTLSLRKCSNSSEDMEFLLEVRNNPDNLSFFKSPIPISRAEHKAWYSNHIVRSNGRCYIIQINEVAVGYVRINYSNEISIALTPTWQGKGVGGKALIEFTRLLSKDNVYDIYAIVLKKMKSPFQFF